MSGITGRKFIFDPHALDNGAVDKRNKCFCRNGNCMPSGLIDVSECYYGFPIALSYPHFLDADPQLRTYVDGSDPNYEKHHSYFLLQEVSDQ